MTSAIDSTFIGSGPVDKGPFKTALDTAASEITALQASVTSLSSNILAQYRNRIVNGGMQVSQQFGTAVVDCTTGPTYTVDQWIAALSTTPGGTLRVQQIASATPGGSPFRLRATVQATDGILAAGDAYAITQPIEGQMIADAYFGTAQARQLLVRFGIRSSIASTFGVSIRNSANNRTWLGTVAIGAGEVNTDLVRTLIIPGDVSGTWLNNNGIGLTLGLCLAAGTAFQGVTGWQGGNMLTTSAQTNIMGTASATVELFDVGLYVDTLSLSAFPPWELPAFDDALRQCQRYYVQQEAYARATATAAAQALDTPIYWPTQMRAVPSMSGPVGGISFNISSATPQDPTRQSARFSIVAATAGDYWRLGGVVTASARF